VTWNSYVAPGSSGSIPLLAGGLINTVNGAPLPSYLAIYTMTTAGVTGGASQGESPQSISNLITDGVNIYVAFRDTYPRDWTSYWSVSGLTYSGANLNGAVFNSLGFVRCGGTLAMVVGGDRTPNYPSVETLNLPSTAVNYNNFTSYTGNLSSPHYDGSSVWANIDGTTHIFQINPSTLIETVHTLPAVASGYQTGYDGTYIYLSTGSDVIVWDVASATGTLAGVSLAGAGPIYYSANLGLVVVCENIAGGTNFYTMRVGGGPLTLIGNANTITASVGINVYAIGMCDGPTTDLWASVHDVSSSSTWNIVWKPPAVNTMKIAGII